MAWIAFWIGTRSFAPLKTIPSFGLINRSKPFVWVKNQTLAAADLPAIFGGRTGHPVWGVRGTAS